MGVNMDLEHDGFSSLHRKFANCCAQIYILNTRCGIILLVWPLIHQVVFTSCGDDNLSDTATHQSQNLNYYK